MTTQQYQDLEVKNKLIAKILDARELGDDLLAAIKRAVFDMECPVGTVEEQHLGESTPAEKYGMGTWTIDTAMQGRTPIGSGGGYMLGATGGEATHTLTVNEIPSHTHKLSYSGESGGWASIKTGTSDIETTVSQGVAATGGGAAHNNMQPYMVVNYWKRVA